MAGNFIITDHYMAQYEFFENISLLFYMIQSANAKKIPKQMHI